MSESFDVNMNPEQDAHDFAAAHNCDPGGSSVDDDFCRHGRGDPFFSATSGFEAEVLFATANEIWGEEKPDGG